MKKTRMKSIKDAISAEEWKEIEAHVKQIIMDGKSRDQLNGYIANKIIRNDGSIYNVTYFFNDTYFSPNNSDESESGE